MGEFTEEEESLRRSAAISWVGTWVQTDREGHEAFSRLVMTKPRAASVMHMLISKMGEHNAVVISQKQLAELCGCHLNTIKTALSILKEERWIEAVQVGGSGSVCAYVINDRIAWYGSRDRIRHSRFSATVVASESEQPGGKVDDDRPALRKIPRMNEGERQLPSGAGEAPPSSPALPGLEADLPELRGGEAEGIGAITQRLMRADDED